ncbi:MAG TPA: hypothetical protein V6C57_29620 [Coleofasciculaceae cyanobacterium]
MSQLIIQLPPGVPAPKFEWGQQVEVKRLRSTSRGKVVGFEWWTLQASAAYDHSIDATGWHYVIETLTRSEVHIFSHENDMQAIETAGVKS